MQRFNKIVSQSHTEKGSGEEFLITGIKADNIKRKIKSEIGRQ